MEPWQMRRIEFVEYFITGKGELDKLDAQIAQAQRIVDAGPQTERATGPKSGIKNKGRAMAGESIFNRYSEARHRLEYLKRKREDFVQERSNPADVEARGRLAREIHDRNVREAIQHGDPVPAEVLSDLQTEGADQMSPAETAAQQERQKQRQRKAFDAEMKRRKLFAKFQRGELPREIVVEVWRTAKAQVDSLS